MEPFALLLKATGDAVAYVLDSYKEHYSQASSANYHQIIKDVKDLLCVVQKLEIESATGGFRATSRRAKNNIGEVLNECGQLATLLQSRIKARTLRDDARTSRDIETCYAEIEFFLRTYGRSREEPAIGLGRTERQELEDLSSASTAPMSRLLC